MLQFFFFFKAISQNFVFPSFVFNFIVSIVNIHLFPFLHSKSRITKKNFPLIYTEPAKKKKNRTKGKHGLIVSNRKKINSLPFIAKDAATKMINCCYKIRPFIKILRCPCHWFHSPFSWNKLFLEVMHAIWPKNM